MRVGRKACFSCFGSKQVLGADVLGHVTRRLRGIVRLGSCAGRRQRIPSLLCPVVLWRHGVACVRASSSVG